MCVGGGRVFFGIEGAGTDTLVHEACSCQLVG